MGSSEARRSIAADGSGEQVTFIVIIVRFGKVRNHGILLGVITDDLPRRDAIQVKIVRVFDGQVFSIASQCLLGFFLGFHTDQGGDGMLVDIE